MYNGHKRWNKQLVILHLLSQIKKKQKNKNKI